MVSVVCATNCMKYVVLYAGCVVMHDECMVSTPAHRVWWQLQCEHTEQQKTNSLRFISYGLKCRIPAITEARNLSLHYGLSFADHN